MDALLNRATAIAIVALSYIVTPLAAQPPVLVPPPAPSVAAADVPTSGPLSLSLEDLQQLAQQYNPTLEQARAEINRADGKRRQAGRYPNPTIGYQAGEIGQDGEAGQQGFYVSQQLVTGGKLRLARNEATFRQLRSEKTLSLQEYRVANSVRREYYSVLAAQQMRKLSQELVELIGKAKEIVAKRLEAGEGTKVDLLQVQVQFDLAELLQNRAENRYEAAWSRLQAVVGQRDLVRSPLAGSLVADVPNLTWDESLAKLLSLSPQMARAQLEIDRALAGVARAEAVPIPNLTVQAGSQYDYATRTQIANVQIGFPLPIYNRNRGNISAAQAEWIAATHETRRIELQLQRALADVFQQYSTNRTRALRYNSAILPASREALDLSRDLFNQGEIGFLQLLTAQRSFATTQTDYIESLESLWHSIVAIDGLLVADGLARPESALDDR